MKTYFLFVTIFQKQDSVQRLTIGQHLSDCGMFITTLLAELKDHHGTGKIVRARGTGRLYQNLVCWTWECGYTQELTAVVTACTIPSQAEYQHGWRGALEVLLVAKELLVLG